MRVPGQADAGNSFGFLVSGEYFEALGVRAHSGRLLQESDMRAAGDTPVAVISHTAFERLLGGSPAALGRPLIINGSSFVLIGVAAAEFRGHIAGIAPDFYLPVTQRPLLRPADADMLTDRFGTWLLTGGRIAPGFDLDSVRAELAAISARLNAARGETGAEPHRQLLLSANALHPLPRAVMRGLLIFVGILATLVVALLLVASINVAGLSLARAEERRGELALRLSLGATRGQLALMMLADAAVLSFAATVIGVALAWAGLRLLLAVPLPIPIPLHFDVAPDLRVIGFGALLALATTLCCGLIPAMRAARSRLIGEMQRFRSQRARHLLAVVQVAATLVLLVNGGAILRAMQQLDGADPGMQVEGMLATEFHLETAGYTTAQAMPMGERVLAEARALPGVEQAALAALVPLTQTSMSMGVVSGPGMPGSVRPDANIVSPGYVATLGIALRGRDFNGADRADAPGVVIVNRHLGQQLFGDADPIGRSFDYGSGEDNIHVQVIGVIEDGQYTSLGEAPTGYLLLPLAQHPRTGMNLLLRSELTPAAATAAMRGVLDRLDPNLPPPQVFRLDELAAMALMPQRIASAVVGALGMLGLLLVALGLYGLLAQFVHSHLREIGVRLALGAAPALIRREIQWRGLRLVLIGLAVAIVPALAVLKLVSTAIVGVSAFDLPVLLGTTFGMVAVAMATCLGPALRAAGTSPAVALRHE